MLTRGVAGVVDPQGALVVNLPGSPAGVASGMPVVLSVARHVLDQLGGRRPRDERRAPRARSAPSRSTSTRTSRAVDDAAAGAVTTFVGRVRDHDPDAATAVVALEYSAHPDAEAALRRIATDAIGVDAARSSR